LPFIKIIIGHEKLLPKLNLDSSSLQNYMGLPLYATVFPILNVITYNT
jgi:hypothetical protein